MIFFEIKNIFQKRKSRNWFFIKVTLDRPEELFAVLNEIEEAHSDYQVV